MALNFRFYWREGGTALNLCFLETLGQVKRQKINLLFIYKGPFMQGKTEKTPKAFKLKNPYLG